MLGYCGGEMDLLVKSTLQVTEVSWVSWSCTYLIKPNLQQHID